MSGKKIDETGNRYGRLVVVEVAGKNTSGAYLWKCRCDCGGERVTRGANLRNGHTKSCGCLQKFPSGQAAFNMLYSSYRKKARGREILFDLTKEDFSFITKMNCFYCGKKPNQIMNSPTVNGGYTYNGIDRIDSNKGYTMDNIVPCCGMCNMMKHNYNMKEFLLHIERIYKYRGE